MVLRLNKTIFNMRLADKRNTDVLTVDEMNPIFYLVGFLED